MPTNEERARALVEKMIDAGSIRPETMKKIEEEQKRLAEKRERERADIQKSV